MNSPDELRGRSMALRPLIAVSTLMVLGAAAGAQEISGQIDLDVSAGLSPAATAAEQRQADCNIAENTVTVEGDAFELPGSARRYPLPRATRFVVSASIRDANGESWVLLTSLAGAHVGWVLEKSANHYLTVRCSLDSILTPQRR